ncbi:MAG TPA: HEAT repeat domain-containing protein, partial [Candidatus Obscuribacterales bacterium]
MSVFSRPSPKFDQLARKWLFRTVYPFIFTFFFSFTLNFLTTAPSAQEAHTFKPEDWEIKGIVAALKDPDINVHIEAARKLAQYKIDNPKTLKDYEKLTSHFTQLLQVSSPNARVTAARALGTLHVKEQAPELVKLLKELDGLDAREIVYALVEMNAKEQTPEIVKLLKEPNPDIRRNAIYVLRGVGAKEQVPKIMQLLKDPDPLVQRDAIYAMGELGGKGQIPEVTKFIKNENVDVQIGAIEALALLKAKEQIPELTKLLGDEVNPSSRLAVIKTLNALGVKNLLPELVKILDSKDSYARAQAIEVLVQLRAKNQIPKLIALTREPDAGFSGDVQSEAIKAIAELGTKDQAPELLKIFKDSSLSAKTQVAQAIGKLGAKEQAPALLQLLKDKDSDLFTRLAVAETLGALEVTDQVPEIAKLLQDSNLGVRFAAARVLGLLGTKDKASEISGLILEEAIYEASIVGNFSLHGGVLSSLALPRLRNLGPCNLKTIIQVLNPTYKYASNSAEIRFMAHYLGGGDQEIEIIMQWIGRPQSQPKRLTHAQGAKVLKVFEKAWKPSESLPFLREDLEKQIAVVSNKVSWQLQDIALLQRSYNNLKAANSTQAASVQSVIVSLKGWQWVFGARNTLMFHAAFWLVLIFAYPSSSQIQAIFFWNPWVRKILGVGYVGFLLAWVPFLRQKLFKPFLLSLLADAGLENFNPQAYFPESEVKVKGAEQTQAIALALPAIRGQIVLEGDSGLGKSMFLRHLVQRSQRIVVYLPAQKCDKGVIEAIQAKLHGQAQDAAFLKNLIYSGAIDICIDGLNEVTADTRAKITQFVECYFKGNVIMTTQPLEWTPPSTAKTYVLQPLQRDQIERYLISRQPLLSDAKLQGRDYEQACLRYLTTALSDQQPAEELAAAQRILSNPMDLTIIAKMLAT